MAQDRNELILQFKFASANANRQIKKTEKEMGRLRITTAGLRRSLGAIRNNLLLVSFAFGAVVASIGKVVQVAAKFEAVKTRLVGLTGSVEKAEKAFAKFNAVATTTPFTLDDVVNAGAQLQAFGANSQLLLKEITDLAAFMGTTATEAANAFGRAFAGGAGAADILRERGILNIIKESQGLKDLSKTTLPEFREALISTLQDPTVGIEGSTDRMSKTFVGAFSNMKDSVKLLAKEIGEILMPAIMKATRSIDALADEATRFLRKMRGEIKLSAIELGDAFDNLITPALFAFRDEVSQLELDDLSKQLSLLQDELEKTAPTPIKLSNNIDDLAESVDSTKNAFEILPLSEFAKDNESLVITLDKTSSGFTKTGKAIALDLLPSMKDFIDTQSESVLETQASMVVDEQSREVIARKIEILKQLIELRKEEGALFGDIEEDPFTETLKNLSKEGKLAMRVFDTFGDAFAEAALTATSFEDAAKKAIRSVAAEIISQAATFALMKIFFGGPMAGLSFGDFVMGRMGIKHDGGLIQKFADGGQIMGRDNVPILAQAGEFVMRRDSVQSIGLSALSEMNQTGQMPNNTINVTIQGGVVDQDYVANTLIPAINASGQIVA